MNGINIFEFKDPTLLSIFVTIIAGIGAILFLIYPFPECLTVLGLYRWVLSAILYFWLERIYTNTWVFDKTCLKLKPRRMAFMVFFPYLQLVTPTASLVPVWQCADVGVGEREWKKARPNIFLYFLSISIILTAIISYLNRRNMDFFKDYIYFGSEQLALHFIPWCISICLIMGIIMVWKFNNRQIEKHQNLLSSQSGNDNLEIQLTNEQIKELENVEPIHFEEPIPGVTNAKKNLKTNFLLTTILIWIHIAVLLMVIISLVVDNQPTSSGEGGLMIYMLLVQLLFISPLWIYLTHGIHNAFDITEKPIRPLYTFICLMIPGCNLVYPSLKMMQIWKASDQNSTRENWKNAAPNLVLILNWVLLFIYSWRLIDASGKNFMLNIQENNINAIIAILLLTTIIIFMFQLQARQKKKAIQLNMLPDKRYQNPSSNNIEPGFFHKLD
jgi:hypothetical protein